MNLFNEEWGLQKEQGQVRAAAAAAAAAAADDDDDDCMNKFPCIYLYAYIYMHIFA